MMACGTPCSTEMEDEFEKLLIRMNPPRVTVDNTSDPAATVVKVDSANKFGSLLEVVQVLTDLKLAIRRAYISSDGEWFMDVFHVVDHEGNKLYDGQVIHRIEQSLGAKTLSSKRSAVGFESSSEQTFVELIGRDRPGLLSEVFAVLADLNCNVVNAEVWTHNSRMAAVVCVTDKTSGGAIDDSDHLDTIKQLLRHVMRGNNRDRTKTARAAISSSVTHVERRLHQMMSDHDEDEDYGASYRNKPVVSVESCVERGYTLVNVRCKDRPKLLFDTICTLTDLQYVVFHGTVITEGAELYQEYYIRHLDGKPVISGGEREQMMRCMEAAIDRRNTEQGIRLELCCNDRVGLLSDVTRIFRENGLSVTHAEVTTKGSQAMNTFYVVDASGAPSVLCHTIQAVRQEIGERILLHVKEDEVVGSSEDGGGASSFSFGKLIRSSSEKFLYNLGLIKSYS